MAFAVIIPARLASTRLPRKILADLAGKPMVVRVAEQAARSGADLVCVATDAHEIADACRTYGIKALMTRSDHASGTDRLAEAARQLQLEDDAIVVNVQGDEPLIDPALIAAVADLLAARPGIPMATAAHAISRPADFANPNVVKVVTDRQGCALMFSRAPLPWWRDGASNAQAMLPSTPQALRHIGLYAYRAAFLHAFARMPACALEQCEGLEQLRVLWHGHRVAVHLAAEAPAPGVDTAADLARVRAILGAPLGPSSPDRNT